MKAAREARDWGVMCRELSFFGVRRLASNFGSTGEAMTWCELKEAASTRGEDDTRKVDMRFMVDTSRYWRNRTQAGKPVRSGVRKGTSAKREVSKHRNP